MATPINGMRTFINELISACLIQVTKLTISPDPTVCLFPFTEPNRIHRVFCPKILLRQRWVVLVSLLSSKTKDASASLQEHYNVGPASEQLEAAEGNRVVEDVLEAGVEALKLEVWVVEAVFEPAAARTKEAEEFGNSCCMVQE